MFTPGKKMAVGAARAELRQRAPKAEYANSNLDRLQAPYRGHQPGETDGACQALACDELVIHEISIDGICGVY